MNKLENRPVLVRGTVSKKAGSAATTSGNFPVPLPTDKPSVLQPISSQAAGRRRYWVAGGLLAVVLGLALYFQPWTTPTTKVVVETIVIAPATRVLAVSGRIAAFRSVHLRPLVCGALAEVIAAEGGVVATGATSVMSP
ncbi:MAG: multidrug efflux pump subunit AcrA (membrane-fusion protein) [Granulosicoccus sp.]|jgi:multidrug efflux pump subunit AcrA (membrane-fusion protein)